MVSRDSHYIVILEKITCQKPHKYETRHFVYYNFDPMRPQVFFLNNIVFGVQNSNINPIFLSGQQFISLMILGIFIWNFCFSVHNEVWHYSLSNALQLRKITQKFTQLFGDFTWVLSHCLSLKWEWVSKNWTSHHLTFQTYAPCGFWIATLRLMLSAVTVH